MVKTTKIENVFKTIKTVKQAKFAEILNEVSLTATKHGFVGKSKKSEESLLSALKFK